MNLSELFRSTAFRIAALYSGLFLITFAAVFAALYGLITAEIERRLKSRILEARDTLIAVHENSGLEALSKTIARKGPVTPDVEDIYLLTDRDGIPIAGNTGTVPRFEDWEELPWKNLPLTAKAQKSASTTMALLTWTPLQDGYLMLGTGNGDIKEAQEVLVEGGAWGLLISVVLSLLGGAMLGWRAQSRISAIGSALDSVAHGNIATRVPQTASGDDLDQVAQQINRTLDRLQGSIGALHQVSTDIAHDLKTPIGRIRHRLELLRRKPAPVAVYDEEIDHALGELDDVTETFEALLRIAQIEGGARKARFAPVNLKDVLENVTEAYSAVGEDTGHHMDVKLPSSGTLVINGDKDLLTQLFANIIENALRHCPQGCRIEVELMQDALRPVVKIADDGPGIPEHERRNVFRRLYRLEKSRTTPGSGLGLSLVAAIAELHEATVELSDNNPGLVVTLTFPAIAQ